MDDLSKWAFGYCAARGYAPPAVAPSPFTLSFEVGKLDQAARLIVGDAAPRSLAMAFATIDRPLIFLEIAASQEKVAPHVPPRWRLRDPAWMMVAGPAMPAATPHPSFHISLEADRRRCEAVARDVDGTIAATGVVGMDGDIAVYDQIATDPRYARRGLGTAVMTHLHRHAAERGATDHLLIATAEGKALYQRLGWRTLSEVVSIISPSA